MKRESWIDKYHKRWVILVKAHMIRNNLTQEEMADRLGQKRPYLCLVLNQKTKLSKKHIERGIEEGIYTVEDIKKDGNGETEAERKFWHGCKGLQRRAIIDVLARASMAGRLKDLERVLQEFEKTLP